MNTTKCSFNIPDDELQKLREMAESGGTTMTYALRRCIVDRYFFQREKEKGAKVLLQNDDVTREVLLGW